MTNKNTCPDCGGNGMLTINSKPPISCDTCKQLKAEAAAIHGWLNEILECLSKHGNMD